MTVSHDVLVERATRGYRFLASDEGKRLGFDVNLLNPDTIDLSSTCDCALGETYEMGSYWDAIERLADENYPVSTIDDAWDIELSGGDRSLTYLWERRHGFATGLGDNPGRTRGYAQLTDAWREVIKRERDGKE
jgi:hypothetical protein